MDRLRAGYPSELPYLRLMARHWMAVSLLVLLPLWCIGVLDRGAWTPDEPREAEIAWRMATQDDRSLPTLAGTVFAEKPPLLYWVAAGASAVFGSSVQASRAPNVLFAMIATIAVGALAAAMAGRAAALLASVMFGTTLLVMRVSIWLATDACLLAGCAIALLGAYRGYLARPGRNKLAWYTLMHAGALIAFFSKNVSGWMVPALALACLIGWERNWRELRRPELYAGFVLQLVPIAMWIAQVHARPDGSRVLEVLFVENTLGRFTSLGAAAGTNYTLGHRNWPGRYLVQLPFALLPWTFCIVGAMSALWQSMRRTPALAVASRFAVSASLPFLLLLSCAATARDIYAAPAMIGLSTLVARWLTHEVTLMGTMDRFALTATRVTVAVMTTALFVALVLLGLAGEPWMFVTACIVLAIGFPTIATAKRLQTAHLSAESVLVLGAGLAVQISVTAVAVFPVIDRWQDLPALTREVLNDTREATLAALSPDETTIAMFDREQGRPVQRLDAAPGQAVAAARAWLCASTDDARVLLVALPGHARGPLNELFQRAAFPRQIVKQKPLTAGIAGDIESARVGHIVREYALPHGRRYAVLAPVAGCAKPIP